MKKGERLDSLLVKRGLFPNPSKARGAILAGEIHVEGKPVTKAGTFIKEGARIEKKGRDLPYVGRGGLKLEKALEHFSVQPEGMEALDLGASTGGFTHCLLQHGARLVYAVDVGYNQLHYALRIHPQVVVMERVNARYLTRDDFPILFPLITIDVSFISLSVILPAAAKLLTERGQILALVKPQFEAGRGRVGKRGVVKDPVIHQKVLEGLMAVGERLGLTAAGVMVSPIPGQKEQNVEFFLSLTVAGQEQKARVQLETALKEARALLVKRGQHPS